MKSLSLKILSTSLWKEYAENIEANLFHKFESLKESELSTENFFFYVSVSAVFSSKIEGEGIDLDSFLKHKKLGVSYQPYYTRKIDDLYEAYVFAQNHSLTEKTLAEVHRHLSKNLLHTSKQGVYRSGNMFVMTADGKIEYVAPSPYVLKFELSDFFEDLNALLNADLSFEQSLFFASQLHLILVKIHPFEDGNGRTARLLEKWFLAEKLGEKAWFLQSEKTYYDNQNGYYAALRALGLEYETLDYSRALPFLTLLPKSL